MRHTTRPVERDGGEGEQSVGGGCRRFITTTVGGLNGRRGRGQQLIFFLVRQVCYVTQSRGCFFSFLVL